VEEEEQEKQEDSRKIFNSLCVCCLYLFTFYIILLFFLVFILCVGWRVSISGRGRCDAKQYNTITRVTMSYFSVQSNIQGTKDQ